MVDYCVSKNSYILLYNTFLFILKQKLKTLLIFKVLKTGWLIDYWYLLFEVLKFFIYFV